MIRAFEYLTNLAVRYPLPNPLPRGEGIGLQADFKVQAIFNFVEAALSDDLFIKIRRNHAAAFRSFAVPIIIRTHRHHDHDYRPAAYSGNSLQLYFLHRPRNRHPPVGR